MRTDLVAEMADKIHIPKRLSAQENFIELLIYIVNMII